jgi:c-di-GMP-binding flagellar brake protein YcgR
MPETKENRRYTRYHVPEGSFVTLGPSSTIMGQILDISMGGLAFRYINNDSKTPTRESYADIYLTEGDLCLASVPIRTVSDFDAPDTVTCKADGPLPVSCRGMRRCGVEFGDMSEAQMAQLMQCIQSQSIGAAA